VAGLAVGAAAATVVVATGGDGSAPAYAVERQGDGSVSVTIRSLSDADGLERELRAAGLRAEVAALPAGETCDIAPAAGPAPGGEDAQGARSAQGTAGTHSAQDARATRGGGPSTSSVMRTDDGSTVFTIDPGTLGAGDTVVITTSRPADAPAGADASTISMAVTPGPVPACVTDR
ncbi:MAG TPA: hypothetical protein VFR97_12585, partial [Capillimicrobium sp.]|nr:hypothetical protein [Capillimicrobium sp.]